MKENLYTLFSTHHRIYGFLGTIPLVCLVSSTIGTSSLCLGGFAPWSDFWSIWSTWWIGDSIGILVVVPVATFWVVELSRLVLKEKLTFVSPIVLTISITLLVFFMVRNNEVESLKSHFKRKVEKSVAALERGIKENMKHIDALGGLLAVIGDSISLGQFQAYCRVITQQIPSIQAMEWIPIIPHNQRRLFEEQATQQWGQRIEIREWHEGKMVPARTRERYMPVYFVEPLLGNKEALGYDLSSNPSRLQTMHHAIHFNQNTLSSPVVLVQETADSFGYLYFVPVSLLQDVGNGQREPFGFAVGVFRVDTLVAYLHHTLGMQDISSRISEEFG